MSAACGIQHRPGSAAQRACPVHGVVRRGASLAGVGVPAAALLGAAAETTRLRALASSNDADDRVQVARDPACPEDVLGWLADDPDETVAMAVARNPSTPLRTLKWLLDSGRTQVTFAVGTSPNTPPQLLAQMLCGQAAWDIANGRVARDGEDAALVVAGSEEQRAAASNPRTPGEALVWATKSMDPLVRAALADNSALPVDQLRTLAYDPISFVRRKAVRQRRLSAQVLHEIARSNLDGCVEARVEISERIARRFGLDQSNHGAVAMLRDMPWWELDPDSETVALVRALHPNSID